MHRVFGFLWKRRIGINTVRDAMLNVHTACCTVGSRRRQLLTLWLIRSRPYAFCCVDRGLTVPSPLMLPETKRRLFVNLNMRDEISREYPQNLPSMDCSLMKSDCST